MMASKFILPAFIFTIGISSAFAQKTYNVNLYDPMFRGREHSAWLQFRNRPTEPGNYTVFDRLRITDSRICGRFTIDNQGVLRNKTEFGCCFETVDLADTFRVNHNCKCPDSNVYIFNEMIAFGYKNDELDSVKVFVYPKNGISFRKKIKQFKCYAVSEMPFDFIVHSVRFNFNGLPCSYDYKIVTHNHDVFRITNITTKSYHPKDSVTGDFCTMYSYEISGKKMISNFITLVKPGLEKEYQKYTEVK